jgi:hypothetical protein
MTVDTGQPVAEVEPEPMPTIVAPVGMNFVQPPKMQTYNVFLYGPPKVGKTTAAATMAKRGPVLYLNGDLPDATWFIHDLYGPLILEPEIKDWEQGHKYAWEMLAWARTEAKKPVAERVGQFRTMVLDPIGLWHTRLLEDQSNRSSSPQIQHYGHVSMELKRFAYEMCKAEDMNFVMIAHEIATGGDGDNDPREHIPFTGTKAGSEDMGKALAALVSILAYCGQIIERDADGKEIGKKFVAQLASGKGRQGGDRSNTLGITEELDLDAWLTKIEEKRRERKSASAGTPRPVTDQPQA